MHYLVPIYCIITAISVVLAALHMKLLLVFYIAASALLAVAAGDELRGIFSRGNPVQKIIRAILAIIICVIALWLGARCSILLYYRSVDGVLWAILGFVLGFFGNQNYAAKPILRRRRVP